MNHNEYTYLLAEKTALDKMIDNLPESSVIDRMSLEARRKKVEDIIVEILNNGGHIINVKT